ncbi:MAG: phosphatase PAP2 family protein [Candidatus Wallbacteria bacterium]|nr:phosphatase PAP2 family protein [Candidatus Wallbacteria bacterium]
MNIKKTGRILSGLRLEDYIAAGYVLTVGLIYFAAYIRSERVNRGMAMTFYYFLLPFVLILFKEAFSYFFSEKPSTAKFVAVLRDWFPFLIILSMYYGFYDGLNHFIVASDRDALLAAWDERLFGCRPSVWLERFIAVPFLVEWLSFAYLSFIVIPPVVALYYYVKGNSLAFRMLMLCFVITESIGCMGYLLLPAVGPRFAFPHWYTLALGGGAVADLTDGFINLARLPRDCFPSLHTGLTALCLFSAWRYGKPIFLVMFPLITSLWVACVFLRYHYLIDVIAGIILAGFVHMAAVAKLERYCGADTADCVCGKKPAELS